MADLREPKNLAKSIQHAERKMKKFRKTRALHISDFAGHLYKGNQSNQTADAERNIRPLNMTYKSCTTLIPNLVYNNPKCAVSSQTIAYRKYADVLELAINHLIGEIKYKDTLRAVIMDAIILAGFTKRGLSVSSQTVDLYGTDVDMGQPFVDRVDADDIIIDPMARCWKEQAFTGNKFRVDKEWMQDNAQYFGMNADDIGLAAEVGQGEGQNAEKISSGGGSIIRGGQDQDLITLAEIYLPRHQMLITVPWGPDGDIGDKVLREVQYEGPESGPYGILGFAFAPNNLMPVAPANSWRTLMEAANHMLKKTIGQVSRQKRILAYENDSSETADTIDEANDGDKVRVSDVDKVKDIDFGGAPRENFQATEFLKNIYSEEAMSVDMLSGAGSNEPTATQSAIVDKNLGVRLDDMRTIVQDFVAEDMKHVAWLLHSDPLIELPLAKRVQGVDEQVVYSPDMREGDWLDFTINVVPYSMVRQTPEMKARRLVEFCGNIIPALSQAQMVLGPAFNLEAAIRILGKEMGIDDLDEIINSQELSNMQATLMSLIDGGTGGVPLKPAMATGQQPGQTKIPQVQQANPHGNVRQGQSDTMEQRQLNHAAEGQSQSDTQKGL